MKKYIGAFGLIGLFYLGIDSERKNIFYEEGERTRPIIQARAICKSEENGLSLEGLVGIDFFNGNQFFNRYKRRHNGTDKPDYFEKNFRKVYYKTKIV